MPKAVVHPHPTHDIRCADCKFFHPDYLIAVAIFPDGRQLPFREITEHMIKSGASGDIPKLLTTNSSMCFRFPQWVSRFDDHYCGEWAAAK